MASITTDREGRRRIQFFTGDGTRKTIYLGKVTIKDAQGIQRHVEEILSSGASGQPMAMDTANWLARIDQKWHAKLAGVGLVEPKEVRTMQLGDFLKEFILSRPDVKPATLEVWQQPCRNLIEYFGADKQLRKVTVGQCDQFKAWLNTQGLAAATLAKRLAFARTFFHTARKHKFIDENPFAEIKIPHANVSARQRFIDRETTQKLLDHANPTWRTIIALCRFGGLRCPSEVLSLEWRHIDWEAKRITVISPKTERYDGKGSRVIPMYPELHQYLQEAYELAEPGQTHVVGAGYLLRAQRPTGWKSCNLRTGFGKLIKRAGLELWPRMFHNLRSSRVTELLETHPPYVVSDWMGHDAKVALKHYAQITNEHFERATKGSIDTREQYVQKTTQHSTEGYGEVRRVNSEMPIKIEVCETSLEETEPCIIVKRRERDSNSR
ncbi:MAG: site-specific integrase [Zavarzinella sp.]